MTRLREFIARKTFFFRFQLALGNPVFVAAWRIFWSYFNGGRVFIDPSQGLRIPNRRKEKK